MNLGDPDLRTIFLEFSICSRWTLKFLSISAPCSSVSNAIRWLSINRLLPSSRVSVPARSRCLSFPYGLSELAPLLPPKPKTSLRETAACNSLERFLQRVSSDFALLCRDVYGDLMDFGMA